MSHPAAQPQFVDNGDGMCWHCGRPLAEHCDPACAVCRLPEAEHDGTEAHRFQPSHIPVRRACPARMRGLEECVQALAILVAEAACNYDIAVMSWDRARRALALLGKGQI